MPHIRHDTKSYNYSRNAIRRCQFFFFFCLLFSSFDVLFIDSFAGDIYYSFIRSAEWSTTKLISVRHLVSYCTCTWQTEALSTHVARIRKHELLPHRENFRYTNSVDLSLSYDILKLVEYAASCSFILFSCYRKCDRYLSPPEIRRAKFYSGFRCWILSDLGGTLTIFKVSYQYVCSTLNILPQSLLLCGKRMIFSSRL